MIVAVEVRLFMVWRFIGSWVARPNAIYWLIV
jgi:hypothetical protein